MNYLGIDYGEVNYGFAIGNSITKNSTTYFSEKIASEKEALKFIENLIKEWDLKGIILGYPLNMDDTDSKLSLKVSKFKIACEQLFDIDVELEDERLTTWEAKKIMSDKNNLTDKKTTSHALAAKIILDTWLNKK
ncbi:Holliday junction resolvase RuvX [SAR86 cluster bacterium]|jgi:putative Holliday junction resolvase|nr:Holliday junction resolvase RuvX [SAR86 cluster bacterium]MEC7197733.1 Holliday junction resolvase RuvX [Pseudomonadota bacterium]MEC8108192.1 Holliday junction resolvase RuvX [Pseudomonadota bacterium]MEC9226689.1 Holliday junction resolvase RuvX [Pseudomonadota bacterium]GIR51623.1 MAG: putative pre-16S rRNA nuclease [Gammaproteobacteria bacterium]|tara:strand:- start:107 stop:511 length:405 start_codon:yes stop_codon:yes gene_type:complete